MKDDFGVLPLPKGNDIAKNAPYQGIYSDSRFFCLLDTVDRDKACKIFDVLSDKTLKKEDWAQKCRKEDRITADGVEMLKLCVNNPVIDMLGQVTSVKGVVQTAVTEAVEKGSVASKLKSVEKAAQAALDDQFRQN